MASDDLVIRVGGESGEGIVTLGDVLARIAVRDDFIVEKRVAGYGLGLSVRSSSCSIIRADFRWAKFPIA